MSSKLIACTVLLVAVTGCGGGASFGPGAERDPYGGDAQFSLGVTVPFGGEPVAGAADRTGVEEEIERRRATARRRP